MSLRHPLLLSVATLLLLSTSASAAITGTVVNSDGAPIAGAKVFAFAAETVDARRARHVTKTPERVPIATTTTGTNGTFTVDDKKEAIVDVRIEAKGFAPAASRYVTNEDAGAIPLTAAQTKSGTITAAGKPVAGATVVWSGDAEYVTTTDANGKYSAPDPEKFANRLIVFHPDFAPIDEGISPVGDARKNLNRTLNAGVAIKGRVVAADGTSPIAKAPLFADNWPLAVSGDDGSFTIAHATRDWALIDARLGDRSAARAHANGELTLKLLKGGIVAGVVRDAKTQDTLAGIELRLSTGGGPFAVASRAAYSDAKGNYSIAPIAAGTYSLSATRPGFASTPMQVAVNAGQTLNKPLYLTERARISGSVVDEEKRPVAGAWVSAKQAGRDMGMMMFGRQSQGVAPSISGPDGRFIVRSAETNGDLYVEAQKRGFPVAKTSTMKVNAGEKKTGVIVTIPRGLTLSGQVLDHDKRPVSGVIIDAAEASNDMQQQMVRRVMVSISRSNDEQLVRTASDGTFSMKLKEGTYDLTLKREGFSTKNLRSQQVNATTKPIEVVLDPGVEITGRVTRGGAGVEAVSVTAVSQDGFATTQSASDGSFRLGDLTPGPMMLSVNKPDALVQTMRTVTAPARDVTVELPAGGRITGRVIDKTTHQPVTNFQAGVTVPRGGGGMVVAMPPMLRTFTSDDGSFTLENVPPGQMELIANAPGYSTTRMPALNVEDGKTLENIEVGLETGVRLAGRVTGSDGAPLSAVTVRPESSAAGGRVMRAGPQGADSTAVTDPNGEYTMDSLEPGEKTFTFNRSGYLAESKTVNLAGRETRLDVQLSTGMRISGSVATDSGAPVADATVTASSGSEMFGGRGVHTDASGSFQYEGLAPGHYSFTASKTGFPNALLRDVDISSGAPVRLVMKGGGIITGHVSGLTDRELQDTTVSAVGATGNASAPVDANGNFRIEGSPTGTVRVSARSGQFFGANAKSSPTKTVEVAAGASATADLEFKSSTIVRGRVTRNRQALGNAIVAFIPKSGKASTNVSTTTDANGAYEASGLDDAPYNVQVVDMERVTPFTTAYEVKGSGTFDIDIVTANVRGRVVDSSTGEPLVDAHVEIKAAGSESFFSARGAQTDSGGNFLIGSVGRGLYSATAEKRGYGNETKDFTITDSDSELELKIAPSAGVTLHVVDARDQRLLYATVRIVDAQGRDQDPGFFRPGVPEPITLTLSPGAYRITVTSPGYSTRTLSISAPSDQTVAMSPGGTIVLHSKSSKALRGRLYDSNGNLYSVVVRGPFAQPIFQVNANPGATTIDNVGAGTYRLELIDKDDKIVATTTVTVAEGQQLDVAL